MDNNETTVYEEVDAGFDMTAMPEWMQRVISRIMFVIGKLLIKFGIKMVLPF